MLIPSITYPENFSGFGNKSSISVLYRLERAEIPSQLGYRFSGITSDTLVIATAMESSLFKLHLEHISETTTIRKPNG